MGLSPSRSGRFMQDRGWGFPGIHALGLWVNKGKRKAEALCPGPPKVALALLGYTLLEHPHPLLRRYGRERVYIE